MRTICRAILLYFALAATALCAEKPCVILISFDGFRWDYPDRELTPNLSKLIAIGVRASSLQPAFPSKTFPNHVSIVTGMYPENHGIIHNDFINPFTGEIFGIGGNLAKLQSKWYEGEFIWETLQRQGIRCASFFWPGSDIQDAQRRPELFKQYQHNLPYRERVQGVIEWLRLPRNQRPHFISMYFHETDSKGHTFGPNSEETNAAIALLDSTLGQLLHGLERIGMRDSTNIIIVSDHGMTDISNDRIIRVDQITGDAQVDWLGWGPVIGAWGDEAVLKVAYHRLKKNEKHFRVYWREDMPAHFHHKNHSFIPPLVLVAEMGWSLMANEDPVISKGNHGYDNFHLDMHGIFIAQGPAFRVGYKTGTVRNIDIYPLICDIFGVMPKQNIDGRLNAISPVLSEKSDTITK